PTEYEIELAEQLSSNLKISSNTFGLQEKLLNNQEFKMNFWNFV
ncbi:22777_t:CDS:1, partial [Dentiscutata erythropus]